MNRKLLTTAQVVTSLALAALLIYSIERTAWLFGQFEDWDIAAYAAAIVVELAAVALIVGAGALAHLDTQARAWANRALVAVLSVGALANLSAGYLRGGHKVLWAFGGSPSAYAVAASLWGVINLAVPGLILCLSKLLERLIHAAARPSAQARRKRQVKRLITLLRTWRGELSRLRASADQLRSESAKRADDLRDLATQLRIAHDTSAATAEQADREKAQSAHLAAQVRTAQEEAERLRAQLADRSAEVARLSAETAAQSAADSLDVRGVAQALRDNGMSLRLIGAILGVSEKTIRNWTMDVRTNGHAVEREG